MRLGEESHPQSRRGLVCSHVAGRVEVVVDLSNELQKRPMKFRERGRREEQEEQEEVRDGARAEGVIDGGGKKRSRGKVWRLWLV